MKKTDKTKTIVSLAIIVALAVFIVNANKVIPSQTSDTVKLQAEQEPQDKELTAETAIDYGKCFSDYGESPDAVVFVHSNSCPYCNSMKPIIKELENQGYKFYWAEGSDTKANNIVSSCFSALLSGYVPQFICPQTGKEQTGAMIQEQLKEFADNCI